MDLKEVNLLSKEIRNKYFELEKEIHGSVWSVEEDAILNPHACKSPRRVIQYKLYIHF